MQFKDIIGQKDTIKRLISSFNEDRISHAQLFLGPEGNGSLALAIAYSQYINCQYKTADDSCGTCPSCLKYAHLSHPDLHFAFPVISNKDFKEPVSDNFIKEWRVINTEKQSIFSFNDWLDCLEAENKQGIIPKRESNEIIRKLNLKTYEADYKTMIIWMADKMNTECANTILKTLEEPYPNTLFILIAENSEQMLQTILSRSQMIKVPKIDTQSLTGYLKKEFDLNDEEALSAAKKSNGNVVNARNIINSSEQLAQFFETFVFLMRKAYLSDIGSLLDWSKQVAEWGREKQKSYLEYCLQMIRNNFVLNNKLNDLLFMNKEEQSFSEKFNPFINEQNIEAFSILLSEAHYHIERNGNAKIIFLDLALKIRELFPKKQ